MGKSAIDWTDETWNVTTGCTPKTEGCRNCCAARTWPRVRAHYGGHPFSDVHVHPQKLGDPLRWRKPRRVFPSFLGDLFHIEVPFDFIAAVFGVMMATPEHTYQMLTKRPDRARRFMGEMSKRSARGIITPRELCEHHALAYGVEACHLRADDSDVWPLPNVVLCVSVEDQKTADERIPIVQDTPAAVRGVSLEPMLGPVNMRFALASPGLDWVIVGCESGPKARPCEDRWIRDVIDQCVRYDTPLFVKQKRDSLGGGMIKMPKIDGVVWDQYPEVQR